jgi:ribose/xylose/arabinose/galactoside ABC-type transport system permease subunit
MTATTQPVTPAPASFAGRASGLLRPLYSSQEGVLLLLLVGLIVVVGTANPRFLAQRNISDVLQNTSYTAIAAIGMSMVIISGNIDVSVGSLIGVLATISGQMAVSGYPIWLAWLAPLFFGGVAGAINGFFVAYLRIPAIVVTLGMMSILKGGLILWTGGAWIYDLPEEFHLAQQAPLGVPMPVYFMIGLTIVAALWMRYSPTGRAIYAVGGNKEAARLSGINERAVLMQVFIIHGVLAGVASVMFGTQFTTIQSTVPPGLEMVIITAAVVGGVSILGGTGTVVGSTLASIVIRAIASAMIFIDVSPYWLQAVQGVMILLTVLADILRRRRQIRLIRG